MCVVHITHQVFNQHAGLSQPPWWGLKWLRELAVWVTRGDKGFLPKTLINGRTQLQPQIIHRWFAHFNCYPPLILLAFQNFQQANGKELRTTSSASAATAAKNYPLPLKAPKMHLVMPSLES